MSVGFLVCTCICVRISLVRVHCAHPQWSGPRLHSVLLRKGCVCVCTFVLVKLTSCLSVEPLDIPRHLCLKNMPSLTDEHHAQLSQHALATTLPSALHHIWHFIINPPHLYLRHSLCSNLIHLSWFFLLNWGPLHRVPELATQETPLEWQRGVRPQCSTWFCMTSCYFSLEPNVHVTHERDAVSRSPVLLPSCQEDCSSWTALPCMAHANNSLQSAP